MRELAVFEEYERDFKVTEQVLDTLCLKEQRFNVLVVEVNGKVGGMLVYFFQPFTYDLTPWLIIKELYVSSEHRRGGLASALFDEAISRCRKARGKKIKLEVLTSNLRAQKFYIKKGASLVHEWSLMSRFVE